MSRSNSLKDSDTDNDKTSRGKEHIVIYQVSQEENNIIKGK